MYLFFDTETTGVPANYKAPATDTRNWPRMVQLAWLLYDTEGNQLREGNHIIYPEGYTIPEEAARIHGISTERAQLEGEPIEGALLLFADLISKSTLLIAHNMAFDRRILGAEFIRSGMMDYTEGIRQMCTMERTTNLVGIPAPYGKPGFKWPKLSELHIHLFGEDFADAHNAASDIQATAKCFWELVARKKAGQL